MPTPQKLWNYAAATGGIVNTTTAVTIKGAEGPIVSGQAGRRNYLVALQISHDLLGAVTELAIRDGAGGTVLWRTKLQTPAVEGLPIILPAMVRSSPNMLLEVVTLTAVTGGVFVNAQGYVGD